MPLRFQNLVKKVARLHGFRAVCVFRACYFQHEGRIVAVFRWLDGRVLIDAAHLRADFAASVAEQFGAHYPTDVYCAGGFREVRRNLLSAETA